jgi:hypothetical protein
MSKQSTNDTIQAKIRRARKAIGIVTHDGKVSTGRTTYDYVSHQRLLAAVDPELDAEGLWHAQSVSLDDGRLVVTTTIYNDDGDCLSSDYIVPAPVDAFTRDGAPRTDLQSWGAAQSYGRRLGLMAALGLRDGSDEQAERYQRTAEPAAPADATADEREQRIDALRQACATLKLDRDGLLRAIHDDTPSERLRHWLSSGRDPVELTEQGWGVLMASLSAMTTQTGIDEDMPL